MTQNIGAFRRTSSIILAAVVAGSLGLPGAAQAQMARAGATNAGAMQIGGGTSVPVQQVQYPLAPNAPRVGPPPPRGWRGNGPRAGGRGPGWRGPGYYQRGWGGPGWRGPGYYGPRYYNYNNNGAAVAAGVIGGLALGAAAASAANANQANQANAANWQAYCASKYRSFDPRTGTYLGYDGLRHPCQ